MPRELLVQFGQSLPKVVSDLLARVKRLEIAPIPYLGDWRELAEPLEYVSSTEIQTVNENADLTRIFAIGDPIRYKQGAGYKYGYITYVAATRLRIRAGSDYTVSNSAITDVARGLKLNATGFPVLFNMANSNYTASVGSFTPSVVADNTKTQFFLQGPLVTVRVVTFFATVSNVCQVYLALPTEASETTSPFRPNYSDSRGVDWGVAKLTPGTPDYLEIVPSLTTPSYPTGAGNTNMNFTYDYLVGDS
jgi:hypothetical protein